LYCAGSSKQLVSNHFATVCGVPTELHVTSGQFPLLPVPLFSWELATRISNGSPLW